MRAEIGVRIPQNTHKHTAEKNECMLYYALYDAWVPELVARKWRNIKLARTRAVRKVLGNALACMQMLRSFRRIRALMIL